MTIKLNEIAISNTGITIRTKPKETKGNGVKLIQVKDIELDGIKIPITISKDSIPTKQFLHKGDILFLSKGRKNYATLYKGQFKAAAAVANFIVIKPDKDRVHPPYLTWYLNQPMAQRQIAKGSAGSLIKNVSIKTIDNLKIKLPPMKKQQLIAKIHQASLLETNIQNQIIQKRNLIIKNTLITSLNKQ